MKRTLDAALQSIAQRAEAEAPPPPAYRPAWLRAQYARRQRRLTRQRRWQTLLPAVVAVPVVLVVALSKGAWLQDVGLSQLGAVATSGWTLFGAPLAVIAGLVLVLYVILDAGSILE